MRTSNAHNLCDSLVVGGGGRLDKIPFAIYRGKE